MLYWEGQIRQEEKVKKTKELSEADRYPCAWCLSETTPSINHEYQNLMENGVGLGNGASQHTIQRRSPAVLVFYTA